MIKIQVFIIAFFLGINCFSQIKWPRITKDTNDLIFSGTKINPYEIDYDSTGKITISGYIDAYYAYYGDTSGAHGYEKFPTISPRNNQIGINIVQLSAKYESRNFRGIATLFVGDCPQSSWSPQFNFIQEANVGLRLVKKLWLDAGFFRTHIGLESIQPRENMTLSLSATTYYEPYFLSGAKLTWQQSDKWSFQLNAFNSFNQFIETNKTKAYGFSIAYNPSKKLGFAFSSIACDESPKLSTQTHWRNYNDFYMIYKYNKWVFGMEANFGFQEHTKLSDTTKYAYMFSTNVSLKYRITHQWASYVRLETYYDPDEILTGPIQNSNHTLTGLNLFGSTIGFEYKPIPNTYVRIETRYLLAERHEKIFFYNSNSQNHRWQGMIGIGLWF